jgi:hypothetical protein
MFSGQLIHAIAYRKHRIIKLEGEAASQYSVFIGQKMSLTGQENGGQHA